MKNSWAAALLQWGSSEPSSCNNEGPLSSGEFRTAKKGKKTSNANLQNRQHANSNSEKVKCIISNFPAILPISVLLPDASWTKIFDDVFSITLEHWREIIFTFSRCANWTFWDVIVDNSLDSSNFSIKNTSLNSSWSQLFNDVRILVVSCFAETYTSSALGIDQCESAHSRFAFQFLKKRQHRKFKAMNKILIFLSWV